jgi:hypothetical protein
MTAISVFNETINENTGDIKPEVLVKLKTVLSEFAGVTAIIYPSAAPSIQKAISQIDKALTGREG